MLALELVWKITLSKSKDLPVLGRIAWGPGGQALVNKFILSIWFNHDSSYRKKKRTFWSSIVEIRPEQMAISSTSKTVIFIIWTLVCFMMILFF